MAVEQNRGLSDPNPGTEFIVQLDALELYDEAGQVERRIQLERLQEALARVDASEIHLDVVEL